LPLNRIGEGIGIEIFVVAGGEEEGVVRFAPRKYVLSFFEALSREEASYSSPSVEEDHLDLRPYLLSSSSSSPANSSVIGQGGKGSDEIEVMVEHRGGRRGTRGADAGNEKGVGDGDGDGDGEGVQTGSSEDILFGVTN